jgi:deoxyxylulose-5-phosphate synthase
VLEVLADIEDRPPVLRIGLPDGAFVDHGAVTDLRRLVRIDESGIREQVEAALTAHGVVPRAIVHAEV